MNFMSTPIPLKIAYIGGGSRDWARKLMIDLALCPDLTGEVALYDIDMDSARLNEQLGNWMQTSTWCCIAMALHSRAYFERDIAQCRFRHHLHSARLFGIDA